LIGRTLAHYRILSRLGAGGMGEVYLAEDQRLGRKVALKVLHSEVSSDAERLRRFEREARTLASLDHPGIVTVHSVEEDEGIRFLTMAHVEGKTLDQLIPDGGMPIGILLEHAIALADALSSAHGQGVIHRDLKPANLMIDGNGRLRVLDFGLAKLIADPAAPEGAALPTRSLSEEGLVVGTVHYMSPEQLEARPVDARTDIFSCGILLYEMATGHRPFQGESAMAVASAILKDPPPHLELERADLPGRLASIVDRCLEKDPDRRTPSARALLEDLRGVQRELASLALAQTTVGVPAKPGRKRAARQLVAPLAGAAVVIGVAFLTAAIGFDLGGMRSRIFSGGTRAAAVPQPEPASIRSLAVLPLDNLSGDPDQEFLADGMTEALITDLSKIGGLHVISRTSVMRYRDSGRPLPEIARELGVEGVVEGSVAREGDRVRVTAQLIHAATDRHVWAESYEREMSSILALQGEVARAVAAEIELQLTPREEASLSDRRAVDPEGYQDYLRGIYLLNQGTPEGNERGLGYLHRAVERDPASAPANAALAMGYMIAAHGPSPPPDAFGLSRAAARRALELDEANATAHAALAMIAEYETWDWDEALAEFRRALELDPSLAETRAHYAFHLQLRGRSEEALAEMRTARRIDPLTPLWPAWHSWQFTEERRYDEAIAAARDALELDPDHGVALFTLGYAQGARGDFDDALAAHRRAAEVSPQWRTAPALTLALKGDAAGARAIADPIAAEGRLWDTYFLAMIYAVLGDSEASLASLEGAFGEPHHPYAPWIERSHWLDRVRDEPRYLELLARLHLPPEGILPRS